MKKLLKKLMIALLICAGAFTIYIFATLPDINKETYRQVTKAEVISSDGTTLGQIASKNITYVTQEDIPLTLMHAVVAVEDKRYYDHKGVDLRGILRAFVENLKAGEITEGGSTITQQVASLLYFDKSQSYIRKAREAITALRLNKKYTKEEILTIYLNEIYLGGGAYGVYEASQTYFSKTPKQLTLAECAMLAGIIQAPSAYCPLTEEGYSYADERKNKVLDVMALEGYITEDEAEAAKAQKVVIDPANESAFTNGSCLEGCESYMNRVYDQCVAMLKQYYMDNLRYNETEAAYEAENVLFTRNLTINVTLNYGMQKNALDSIEAMLSSKDSLATAALVSVDSNSGNVLAYYGSNTYLDMAQSPRQPGSTIKPLYLAYLIENQIADKNSVVKDEPINIGGYTPNNFAGKYYGYSTMREALVHSMNSACLQFFSMANTRQEIDFVKTLGISTITEEDYNSAFALGGMYKGIKPSELVMAYAAIDNGGMLYNINYVVSIVDEEGKIVFPKENKGTKVLSINTVTQLKSCLESVVIRGTATAASTGYATIGKTGTTDNGRDVWFAGATGNVTTAIWCGNVDAKEVSGISSSWCSGIYKKMVSESISDGVFPKNKLTNQRSESTVTIDILMNDNASTDDIKDADVVSILIPDYEESAFGSKEVVKCTIDSTTGMLFVEGKCSEENRVVKYYLKSQAPTEYCNKNHLFDNWDDWFRKYWNR